MIWAVWECSVRVMRFPYCAGTAGGRVPRIDEGGDFPEAHPARADARDGPLHVLRSHVHDPLDAERDRRRRLLELSSRLHRRGADRADRQSDRAVRAPPAAGGPHLRYERNVKNLSTI